MRKYDLPACSQWPYKCPKLNSTCIEPEYFIFITWLHFVYFFFMLSACSPWTVDVATCLLYQVHANRVQTLHSMPHCRGKRYEFSWMWVYCEHQECELCAVDWRLECLHFQFYHYFCICRKWNAQAHVTLLLLLVIAKQDAGLFHIVSYF